MPQSGIQDIFSQQTPAPSAEIVAVGAQQKTGPSVAVESGAHAMGVDAHWGFATTHGFWHHVRPLDRRKTDAALPGVFDIRPPLAFSQADYAPIAPPIMPIYRKAVTQVAP